MCRPVRGDLDQLTGDAVAARLLRAYQVAIARAGIARVRIRLLECAVRMEDNLSALEKALPVSQLTTLNDGRLRRFFRRMRTAGPNTETAGNGTRDHNHRS